jgi:EpsI family protein
MEPQVEHFLGLTDYILSNYTKADNRSVNLYVAYYASQRKGVSPHSPSVCIPGNGWQISEFERTRYTDAASGTDLPYNRVIVEKDSQRQIVYYWFEQRGLKIENEWWSKWYLLKDAILRNRTDGALVRLTTPIYRNETEAEADRRLQTFIREAVPSLAGYLPSAGPTSPAVPAQKSAPRVSKL